MGVPYELDKYLTTTGSDEVVELDFPGRVEITKISMVGSAAIDLDLFSRRFDSDGEDIHSIVAGTLFGGGTGTHIVPRRGVFFPYKVGDSIVVAGNSVGGYNATHIVQEIIEAEDQEGTKIQVLRTNQAYSADGTGGDATLAVTTAMEEAYRVVDNIAGASPQKVIPASGDNIYYINQDPRPNANIGHKRKLYARIANVGTYRLVIQAVDTIAN